MKMAMTQMGETVQRALVVEDDVEMRRFVRMSLDAEGFEAQLRKKVEGDPSQPRYLLAEVGVGCRFVP